MESLHLLAGREINAQTIADADALLIRSVTNVDKALLEQSNVKFVGTATSGTDHIDQAYLANNDIIFAHAHGSNAQAVADYCLSALIGFSKIITLEEKKKPGWYCRPWCSRFSACSFAEVHRY